MNINVKDLDLGYNQCEGLNTLSKTDGGNLISSLYTDITNLKVHWKGNDATEHINNLIKVYNALISIVTDAKSVTSAAGNAIIEIQKVRRANGGSGEVGAPLDGNAPESSVIANAEVTTEYYCDPSARTDYTTLEEICTNYDIFVTKFTTQKDELMNNWTAGANREQAVSCFQNFTDNTATYKTYLTNARDNLGIAVNNISSLG